MSGASAASMSKRPRASRAEQGPALASAAGDGLHPADDDSDRNVAVHVRDPDDEAEDDQPLHRNFKMSKAVRTGAECPYLDTISRQVSCCGLWFCCGW